MSEVNLKLFVFTKYQRLGASSRVRFLKYMDFFDKSLNITVSSLFNDSYVTNLYNKKRKSKKAVFFSYLRRIYTIFYVLFNREIEVIWIEKELLPYIPIPIELFFMFSSKKVVFDYDDAVFHNYLKSNICKLHRFKFFLIARYADHIMVGNNYISKYFQDLGGSDITIIPTVVDKDFYSVSKKKNLKIKIVWIGTPNTQKYLYLIDDSINKLQEEFDVEFVAIGVNSKSFKLNSKMTVLPWSEDTESKYIASSDIGVMPVYDNLFEQGKCGFKLIQYMACGLPTVASPVGANIPISLNSGLLAKKDSDWYDTLKSLIEDKALRVNLGKIGRNKVENKYSYQVQVKNIEKILNSLNS